MIGAIIWVCLIGFMFIGVPIAFSMGISATIMLLINRTATSVVIAQKAVNALDSFTIMAIPFFMMASSILSGADVGKKIFRFAGTLVQHLPGGLAHVNILTSMIMAGMSGSSVSDVSGIGKMEMDAMTDAGYDVPFSAAVTAASSTVAPIIPPSTSMILYGSITGVSIGKLLIGGLLPGILMGLAMGIVAYFISVRRHYPLQPRATRAEILSSLKDSFAALMMPVILIAGIMSGIFTATEAACVATVYSILISLFWYRTINFKKLFHILENTSTFASSTLFVLAMAGVFGLVLTHNQVPTKICNFFLSLSDNKYVLLFLINIMLLILGCLMEGNSIYMILGPVLGVLAVQLGCDPVAFGVMVVFNLTLGLITPPVGLCLFLTQKVAKITSQQMISAIVPFVIVLIVSLLVITYIPQICTILPNLLM
ncbi:MAG: TRAP transporter large permease [Clostridia bacterium]|nr:TRAP transporter large permease [Clostridia bacterium]